MKHRGNMLVMTLVACALLALVLVAGLEVANLSKATQRNQVASLQLEQLYRTALADGLKGLNATNEQVVVGHHLIHDTPLSGQHRKLVVEAVEGRSVFLHSESRLDDGSARKHRVQLFMIPKEQRLAFHLPSQALFYGAQIKDVGARWLEAHTNEDVVLLADGTLTIGNGTALAKPFAGSLLITGWTAENANAVLNTDLRVKGSMVCTGNLSLRHDLSCETAWIDGTLTIDEGIRLTAKSVYLGADVPDSVLKRIQGTIYMPHPPKQEPTPDGEAQASSLDVHELPDNVRPPTDKRLYLMLQQLD